jgi:acyl-CoA synthetase (AMP-forming)/AMP-acid ligase II
MAVGSVPSQACGLLEIAERRAATQSDAIAFRFLANGEDETGHLTYGDLAARARRLAAWLRSVSHSGDRAVLAYPAGLEFPVAFLACLYAGVIAVPVDVPKRFPAPFIRLPRIDVFPIDPIGNVDMAVNKQRRLGR